MKFTRLLPASIAAFLLFSCSKKDTSATSGQTDNCFDEQTVHSGDVIPNQYIIELNPGVDISRAAIQGRSASTPDVLTANHISTSALKATFASDASSGLVATLTPEQVQTLQNDPTVAKVEPDRIVALSTCFTVAAPSLITWNVSRVGYGNGIGKTAWIVDTGIDFTHPDLNVDARRSKSFLPDDTSANDENGHGTHVAGIIGAKNNTFGVLGVASGATLVSLRVLDKDGSGTLSSIIQALAYVNANGKAGDVVNLSLGEDEASDILDQQVEATAAKGIYVTIAAGNDSKAADLYSPGRANGANIYTVSAVDSLDQFASFSNFGNDAVDYAEPGVRILSTFKGGQYARMSGTSMAAPHLAGLLLIDNGQVHAKSFAKNDPDGQADPIGEK